MRKKHWRTISLVGKRFDRLLVESFEGIRHGRRRWRCLCDCGNFVIVSTSSLRTQNTRSCGCLAKETVSNYRHGMHSSREYRIWCSMISRCHSSTSSGYHKYGARGIKVYRRWRQSFEEFYLYVGSAPSPKHGIDRINNSKGYFPGNVRWATQEEQSRNKTTNIWLELGAKRLILKDWAREMGLPYGTLYRRFRVGWDVNRILTK